MRNRAVLSAMAAVVITIGCGSVTPSHYYMLELPQDHANERTVRQTGLAVGVREFTVDPPYDRDTLVYRVAQRPTEIGFYDYHRWAAPLERMLPIVVAAVLSGADEAWLVEPDAGNRSYDALLDGRVIFLEEIDYPGRQDVRLRMALTIRRPDGTEMWSQAAGGEKTLDTNEVGDIAEAMNAVLVQVVEDLKPAFADALEEVVKRSETNR